MNTLVALIAVTIASGALAWLFRGIVSTTDLAVAGLGGAVHVRFHLPPRNESDAWLVSLLFGNAIKIPLVIGVTAAFILISLTSVGVMAQVGEEVGIRLGYVAGFLFVARLSGVFLASVLLGGSVKRVLATLQH